MPNITLKNIPDELYNKLKTSAQVNHRSLNSEILVCLEKTLDTHRVSLSERLAIARKLRQKTAHAPITEQDWNEAKSQGRP